jgi:hypothetical protein
VIVRLCPGAGAGHAGTGPRALRQPACRAEARALQRPALACDKNERGG